MTKLFPMQGHDGPIQLFQDLPALSCQLNPNNPSVRFATSPFNEPLSNQPVENSRDVRLPCKHPIRDLINLKRFAIPTDNSKGVVLRFGKSPRLEERLESKE